jgi:hypothetical protein
VWVVDPWMYAFCDEFTSGKLKIEIPTIIISSERFHPSIKEFKSWDATKSVITHNIEKKCENVVIKNTGHMH